VVRLYITTITMDKLRKKILKRIDLSYEEANKQYKIEQEVNLRTKDDDKIYTDNMYNDFTLESISKIEPEIKFCRTRDDNKLWKLFSVCTSSINVRGSIGRSINFFVIDKTSQKYLGIVRIGGDIRSMNIRDDYLDIHKHFTKLYDFQKDIDKNSKEIEKYNKIITDRTNSIVNIWCCVGLQPVAFNLNIGKLLASLCFSREVLQEYESKYGNKIGAIITHSINGKSIQYSALKYLNFIGYTKGKGTVKLTDEICNELYDLIKTELNIDISKTATRYSKFDKVKSALKYIGLSNDDITKILNHGKQRGVYCNLINNESKKYFSDESIELLEYNYEKIESVDDISNWWKHKWCIPRFKHLILTERLKYTYDLRTIQQKEKSEKNQSYIENKKDELGEVKYNEIQKDYIDNYRKLCEGEEIITNLDDVENITDLYLAGFIDGDGTIAFGNNHIYISIGQCDIRPLLSIQKKYGGMIKKKTTTLKNHREIYIYSLTDTERVTKLVENIINYSIIKKVRFSKALECLKTNNSKIFAKLGNELKNLQKSSAYLTEKNTNFSDEYIAGIVDSEGCIRKNCMYISQKHNQFLILLQKYLGYGTYGNKDVKLKIECWKKDTYKLLTRIKDKLIVKYEQCQAYLSNHEMELEKNINEEKYNKNLEIITDFKYINQAVNNKIIVNTKNKKLDCSNDREFEIVKKFGTDNHRFGQTNSIETRTKSSVSISLANRKFTDNDIDKIREMLSEGKSQINISDELKIHRDTISKVKNNLIFKTDEYTEENIQKIKKRLEDKDVLNIKKAELSDDAKKRNHIIASAVGKRTYTTESVIKLLEYKLNNILLSPEDISNNLNININKIQAKNLISGNCLLYEEEFPVNGYSYDKYIVLIENIKIGIQDTKYIARTIKNRKVSKIDIINVLKLKTTTNLTHQEIVDKIENINSTDQVRNILRNYTKLYECEFPFEYKNELFSYDDYIKLVELV
jgi:nitrogen regulatory protein PII